ncbi:MAG: NAD-dependent epimerase/dehydratase family protein [Crocinitomix sp.]|nr:NAD-dependent epimerase/dehydratase family protein [Crocinitomix sp.]
MKIIITGATGSFGGAMCRHYSQQGHTVVGVGKSEIPPKRLLDFADYLSIDITRPFQLPEADLCIHAAAFSDDKAKMKDLIGPNIAGVANTINAAKQCKTFIFISSSSVYLPQAEKITEDLAGKQNNKQLSAYGLSKLKGEEMIQQHFTGDRCFILRARAFYGPGDTQILPRLLKLHRNNKFNRVGEMKNLQSLTHFENMAHAIDCCIQSDKMGIHTYNVADDQSYVSIELLRKIMHSFYGDDLAEKEIKIGLLKLFAIFKIGGFTPLLVKAMTQNTVLDIGKIKVELSYQPKRDFFESFSETEQWVDAIGGVEVLKSPGKQLCWTGV